VSRIKYIGFFFILFFTSVESIAQQRVNELTQNRLTANGTVELTHWLGIAGDDYSWLNDTVDVQIWTSINPLNLTEDTLPGWDGAGWFRAVLKVEESLVNTPIPIQFSEHNGASDVFLDGDLIFRLGEISSVAEDNVPTKDHLPRFIQLPDTAEHVLIVRFYNHKYSEYQELGLANGFQVMVYDYDFFLSEESNHEVSHTFIVSTIVFLVSLSIVHLLLLIFYPASQKNFYFTFLAAAVALFTLSLNASDLFTNPDFLMYAFYGKHIAWVVGYLCLLKFAYSFTEKSSPKILSAFVIVSLIISFSSIFSGLNLTIVQSIFSILMLFEFIRVIFQQKLKKQPVDLILWGVVGLVLVLVFNNGLNAGFWNSGFPLLTNTNAITVLTASISFFLLRDFAKAQTKLEYKYLEVKHLSERSIDQERRNKEKEFKQKLLEAENERKTAELEEARALQLSMLPASIPESKNWEIAAKMETAYEVGGDYYDFYEASNNDFVAAVGDATGHGMKAGIIVATVKSNFHSNIGSGSLVDVLKQISAGIRNLDLKMLYMGLILLRTKGHHVTLTSAGMPQILWYKASSKAVEEILIKAMPLGVKIEFPYTEVEVDAQKDDVLLFISDGLIELFNRTREQLGIQPIIELLKKKSDSSPEEIVASLFELKKKWSGKAPQEDDVTVMVMKAK